MVLAPCCRGISIYLFFFLSLKLILDVDYKKCTQWPNLGTYRTWCSLKLNIVSEESRIFQKEILNRRIK